MKGCLHIVRDGIEKLRVPATAIEIKNNGTLWYQGRPLLGITDPAIKAKSADAVKAQRWSDIPTEAYTRLGDNSNGLWAGDDDAWIKHPAKIAADAKEQKQAEEKARIERNRGTIFLSSRGWGDYSNVEWNGDITQADIVILAACRQLLTTEHDVDNRDQSDEEILSKIADAKTKHATPREPEPPETHGPGYCYQCDSYCFGDCGNYAPKPTAKTQARELKRMNDEMNYGIND
jgi:hypothetical protein